MKVGVLGQWLGDLADEMDVRATYNLPLNAKFLVRQASAARSPTRGLFEANELNDLAFVPLSPPWNPPGPRLAQDLPPPAQAFWIR